MATTPRNGADSVRPVLQAKGITKAYRRGPLRRREAVLRGADLELCPGQVVGMIGENGSGKSTLMKILVNALRPDSGTVARTGRIGYCPQYPLLYARLNCDEHFDLFGHAYGLSERATEEARQGIYDALGFARYARTRAERLSGGTLAKLNLGLALLADPDLLLLDDPYASFDWETYQKFWELVDQRRRAGRTLLIISHFVIDEQRFDRIVAIKDGKAVPRLVLAFGLAVAMWAGQLLGLAITQRLAWSVELPAGSVLLTALAGGPLALLTGSKVRPCPRPRLRGGRGDPPVIGASRRNSTNRLATTRWNRGIESDVEEA